MKIMIAGIIGCVAVTAGVLLNKMDVLIIGTILCILALALEEK